MFRLDSALEALGHLARRHAGASEAVAQMARRADQLREDVATVAEGSDGAHVAWVDARGRRTSIGASRVDVSTLLRDELFFRTDAIVLTSATLSTAGSFRFAKDRLGIDFDVREEILGSPFDYASQAALYLPAGMPDPRDAAWMDAATDEVLSLVDITQGGAFVLCTSFRVMSALAERARKLLDHPVLVQGDAPKPILLSRFREAGDAVLFATASFWEGVDVPGRALRLVVIDKLPFDVPSDPLVAARCARIEEAGASSFMTYLVPAAALALKQGFGRLVRTADDRGIVAVLDPRIVRKGYGKVFLASLPPARRCDSLDEVRAFWSGPPQPEDVGGQTVEGGAP
jgi:ATP-dependent DNA helicase DinG